MKEDFEDIGKNGRELRELGKRFKGFGEKVRESGEEDLRI